MARVASGVVIRQIGALFDGGSVAGLSDRELLERYIAGGRNAGGQAAFAALVAHHGPMVLSVCRQLLGDMHHAEDAFQAVFLPVVLCYFEGLTLDEAARRLHCPAGTVHSRLARAREKLRRALVRRGIVLAGTAFTAALVSRSAEASLPPLLCDITTHAARGVASASATALAHKALRAMLIQKLRFVAVTLFGLGAIVSVASYLTHSMARQEEAVRSLDGQPPRLAARLADRPRQQEKAEPTSPARMTVTGRVLRHDGRPAGGVPVDIVASSRAPEAKSELARVSYVVLGQGSADRDGRFRIDASRASSASFYDVYALAGAAGPGSGFGSVRLNPDDEEPTVEIHLPPAQPILGRLVDVSGQPATAVEIHVDRIYSSSPLQGSRFDSPALDRGYLRSAPINELRAWPKPVTTDAQGRFTFVTIGRGLSVALAIRAPRFAQQRFNFEANDRDAAKEVSLALHPSTIIEGRTLAADTGEPIPNAVISINGDFGMASSGVRTAFRADGQGRFKLNPYAGDYFRIHAVPPEGQPYMAREVELRWTKGAVKKELDLTLPRGVLIRGKVTEEGTGKPVAAASAQFFPINAPRELVFGLDTNVISKGDGSFQLAVPPGKGHITVLGPTLGYIPQEISGGKLYEGTRPGGARFYAHAIIAYDVKAGDGPQMVHATLKPGKTLHGRVVGPTGETAEDVVILTRQQLDPYNLTWQEYNFIHAHGGRFELSGFDPEKVAPAYFLDADRGWGATVDLSGKRAGENLTVGLHPCGEAKARFVGPGGRPVAKLKVWNYIQILMTPGAPRLGFLDRGETLAADGAFLPNVDSKHHPVELATNAEGRVSLPALIPGALYRISDWSTVNVPGKGYQVRKDFTVKPGETLDLGDILVERPQEQ